MAPYSGGHFLDLQPQIARRVPAEGISLSYITARRFKAGVPCLLHELGDWGAGSIGSRNKASSQRVATLDPVVR
jgi:hypothetical protein